MQDLTTPGLSSSTNSGMLERTETSQPTVTTARQDELFTEVALARSRIKPHFMSGIYLKYLFCSAMSLHKSLRSIYVVNLMIALVTAVTIVPIT